MVSDDSARLTSCLDLAQAIGRSTRHGDVLEAALDALDRGLGVSRAAFLLFDAESVMRFEAWRGLSETYRRAVEGHSPWTPRDPHATPIVVPDVSDAPDLAPFLDVLRAEGIASLVFVPLVSAGGVIGKFMLYAEEPRQWPADELHLAMLIAAQTAFAVDNLRAQAEVAEVHAARVEAIEQSGRVADRLAAIVESSADAIVSKTLEGIVTSWNRSAERIFGYSAQEAIGQSINLIVPLDRRDEEQMVLGSIRQGRGIQLETLRRRKDGVLIDIALTVSPVRNRAGTVVGASKIARDITERKRSEAELADLHTRLKALVEASASLLGAPDESAVHATVLGIARRLLAADAYAIWKPDGDAGPWRMAQADGVSADFAADVVSSTDEPSPASALSGPMAVADVADLPLLERRLAAYRREGMVSLLICPMRAGGSAAGTLVFYYRTPHAFRDVEVETGQTLANLAAAALTSADLYQRERTQREAAELASRRAAFLADASAVLSRSLEYEHTLATVAQLAVPAIADWCAVDIVGAEGRLERVGIAHVDPARLERARELERRYPADPNAPGGVYEVIRTGRPVLVETITDDQLRDVARDEDHLRLLRQLTLTSYISVPLVTPNGASGAITFMSAESGRRYTSDDLQFAQSVAARASLAIDNARAYQRANDANRVKDEFLATLSHEMRTPLNAILGYAQMLDMGMLSEERRAHAVTVLVRNGETLRQIIDDVLDISRITAGKLRLKMQPLEVGSILRNAAATVQPAADAKGVVLELLVDDPVALVAGDPDRLQQVAWNLLSNAVKFTPRGGHVQVRLEQIESAVEIAVSDSGRGIDPEFLPHMFERFRQADSRFSREHGGLGLGLAIVRELVQLHGGTVAASSRGLGTGSTFRVRLPARIAHDRTPGDAGTPPGTERAAQAHRLDNVRILAVDDEEDSLDMLRAILENAGATVTTANSGPEAIAALRATSFDVLLADIGMPRMDGLELIRTVRSGLPPPINRVPAAALTAYARAEDRINALASGFQMHIPKPVNTVELVIAVSALASRTPAPF